jgi:exosortase family protein XrtF
LQLIFEQDNTDMKPFYSKIANYWKEIPVSVRKFLLRTLIIFSIWKISYHVYIKPHRLLDVPLTTQTSNNTRQLLSIFYPNYHFTTSANKPANKNDFFGVTIYNETKKVVTILDPCNALELFIMYTGFIFCMPSNWKRMALFISIGLASIYLLNIIRCAVLGVLNINRSLYIDFAHHYLFTMVVYIAIFLGWALYIKKSTNEII